MDNREEEIKETLFTKDPNELMKLIPTLTEDQANYYIKKWFELLDETMYKIRHNLDSDKEVSESYELIDTLSDMIKSSSFGK